MFKLNQKYIEKIFYNYDKIKQAVYETRNDPARVRTGDNSGGHAFVSDPTANVALREATELYKVVIDMGKNQDGTVISEPERWLRVVDYTYEYFDKKLADEVAKRRFSGEDYRKICTELCISQNVYYCIISDVGHHA